MAQKDLNERLLRLLKRWQSIEIGIKADILEFQETSELGFEVDQTKYEYGV